MKLRIAKRRTSGSGPRCVLLGCCLPLILAMTAFSAADDVARADGAVSASVDGEPIYRREVDRVVERALGDRSAQAAAMVELRNQALSQLINRRLALKTLKREGLSASRQEIERQVRRMTAALQVQELEMDQYLRSENLTTLQLQQRIAWEIGWKRFLEKHLTDENLARYFQQHRRDFDGTEVDVAQILFRVEPPDDCEALERALTQAADVRRQIQTGELAFAAASRQYSAAPSAAEGGQIGRIRRHEPMPEAFSRAAFALDDGEVSAPVVSPFGVHLIQCQGIEPGQLQWQDVRKALESAVIRHLFDWAADQQRQRADIQILEGG